MARARSLPVSLSLLAVVYGAGTSAPGCQKADAQVAHRTLYFAGAPVARIEERLDVDGRTRSVTPIATLEETGEQTVLTATLDAQGFALAGRYVRGILREVSLEQLAAPTRFAPPRRVVLIDLLGHVQPPSPTEVAIVDLSSAEVIAGRVERRNAEIVAVDRFGAVIARANVEGHRSGPGVFFEGDGAPATARAPVEIPTVEPRANGAWLLVGVGDVLGALSADGPGQRRLGDALVHSSEPVVEAPSTDTLAPQPFIESDDARVVAWAGALSGGADPLAQAARLVEAIHPMVDATKRAVPPGAVVMLERGGDCDGAAALLTAGLRARGTPARPVVGYRWVEGRFVPHAWVEVYTPAGWMLADATVPRLGDDSTYLKLFDGLGGALTMGRVLGRLQLEPMAAPGAP